MYTRAIFDIWFSHLDKCHDRSVHVFRCVSGSFWVWMSTLITAVVFVAAAVELSRRVPALAAEHWFTLALSSRDLTERADRFCVGETCQLLFGFCHDSVSHVFSSVCYHGNRVIGMLSSHALSFTTSALGCCSIPSYALNQTLRSVSPVLGKSRAFRPYEGSRCSLWIFSSIGQSLNQSCQHWTYFFTDH